MPHTTYNNEKELVRVGDAVFVQAEDCGRRVYVAVNPKGYTDYPLPVRFADSFVTLWDRPEAFSVKFRAQVSDWMRENFLGPRLAV